MAQLNLNEPYIIFNAQFNCYLAADTSGSYEGVFFGYLFYCRRPRAAKFMFRQKNNRTKKGQITKGMEVELTLCDEEGQPIAVVERFKHDDTTLLVSKYGVSKDLCVSQFNV